MTSSTALFERASRVVPGGVSRQTLGPVPVFAQRAGGVVVTDVEGRELLDFVANHTSLVHGHAFPPVVRAVTDGMAGLPLGTAHAVEAEFAELLRDRVPALDWLHFTTTGSEAVSYAARVARAVTGRSRLLTFEGGFHGSANEFVRDVHGEPLPAGSVVAARPASAGLEPTTALTAVYGDRGSVDAAFAGFGPDIAAVVVEPFLGNGGLVEAPREFLDHLFTTARSHGALVVLDEVQSIRTGPGGVHGLDGLEPDLVTIGKVIGGGFPLAAFGGRRGLAGVLEGPTPALVQTGTFTGMPLALTAGLVATRHLGTAEFAHLDDLGERLREGLRRELSDARVVGHVNGRGSMANVGFGVPTVGSYRALRATDGARLATVHDGLLERGVLLMSRGTAVLTTAHTSGHVDVLLSAFRETLAATR